MDKVAFGVVSKVCVKELLKTHPEFQSVALI